MTPFGNVLLGTGLGILALVLGGIKLISPASPWHRRGGWLAALTAIVLFRTMIERTIQYQVSLSWWSRMHAVLGIAAFLLFTVKLCAARKWYFTPRLMRPLGIALTALFPLAAFGLGLPFFSNASSWIPLKPAEVTRNPDQGSFDRVCTTCHAREKAVEDLGIRPIRDWIDITAPMAWAEALSRESTRGALAAILPASPTAEAGKYPLSVASAPLDPIDRHCILCHDRRRVLGVRKTPELWKQTIDRMRGYAQKMPNAPKMDENSTKEVLEFLCQKQP